ncbi:MAG: deoxynucleoside kinase [Myxococcota bacterium]|nr:deoxynucleoside kinase [Myxococcota bacterium]
MGSTKYIAVAGNIGCGKTTLVDFVCRNYGVQPFFEPNAENPYLTDFYGDMKKWAFHSQVYFLTHKFRIHQELERRRQYETILQDRTIYEDAEVFATYLYRRRCIGHRDWGLYKELYDTILASLKPPDLVIYLRASVRTIRKRIKQRGRPEEQGIPVSYLRKLNELYEGWFEVYDRSPTIVLNTDNLNYIEDLEHLIDVRKAIEKFL